MIDTLIQRKEEQKKEKKMNKVTSCMFPTCGMAYELCIGAPVRFQRS